ncbi:hypothetical protein DMN91_005435, partial [Ooceraea biroi]
MEDFSVEQLREEAVRLGISASSDRNELIDLVYTQPSNLDSLRSEAIDRIMSVVERSGTTEAPAGLSRERFENVEQIPTPALGERSSTEGMLKQVLASVDVMLQHQREAHLQQQQVLLQQQQQFQQVLQLIGNSVVEKMTRAVEQERVAGGSAENHGV